MEKPEKGKAVLIYVTEDFLNKEQVKANRKSKVSQTVLKLNRTKKFNTGIYPYSIMTSLFTRLGQKKPLAKDYHFCSRMVWTSLYSIKSERSITNLKSFLF